MAVADIGTGPTVAAAPRRDPVGEVLPDRFVEGDAVGDYVIEQFLGAGAMGDVYAGRHPVIGKRVAIKVLKRELASDREASERFIREAKAVNQIDHPNVINVFNFGQLKGDDGRLFLVMDLVDGKSLRKLVEEGPLPVGTALDILAKIADALDAAHARGVIHRDLKPDNVMLSKTNQVFVLDFGIAKLFSATATGSGGNGTLTGKGTWLGTPGYMAPEQWSAEGASTASDRYALGVMAYELISGVLPFKAPTLPQMMEQHFRSPVPALSLTLPKLEHHAAIQPVLARAMAKNPDERFASGHDMVEALRQASQGKKVIATKRSLTVPAIAGVSVLGLAIVGVFVLRTKDDDTDPRARPNAALPSETASSRIELDVVTRPDQATVSRDGVQLGQTPFKKEIDASGKGVLTIRKPGYRTVTETVAFDRSVALSKDLQPILGFEGVWAMPDGKLRGFWRTQTGKVDVYRLESVTSSERELWRTCDLVLGPAGKDLVVFATTADLTDERAHAGDAGCSNPHGIEYTFDPEAQTLSVRVERIETRRKDGHCEVVSKTWREPRLLTRADDRTTRGETRVTEPPVGVPIKSKVNDSLDNAFDGGKSPRLPDDDKKLKAQLLENKSGKSPVTNTAKPIKAPTKPAPVPTTKKPPSKANSKESDKANFDDDAAIPQTQTPTIGKPINTAPQKQAPKPIQKSQAPVNAPNSSAPQAQAPQSPQGDSQAAK